MNRQELIELARRYLCDRDGKIWNDTELDRMLDEAVRKYSEDTGIFHGEFSFYPDEHGVYHYPSDFICYHAGWNHSGQQIHAICSYELEKFYPDFLTVNGMPEFILDDLSTAGEYQLCPNPSELQHLESVSITGDYGVSTADYGCIQPGDYYGTVCGMQRYEPVGEIMYSRYAELSEIEDYMSLIYYILYLAYNTDSDFSDAGKAVLCYQKYQTRISMFAQIKHANTGKPVSGYFF